MLIIVFFRFSIGTWKQNHFSFHLKLSTAATRVIHTLRFRGIAEKKTETHCKGITASPFSNNTKVHKILLYKVSYYVNQQVWEYMKILHQE